MWLGPQSSHPRSAWSRERQVLLPTDAALCHVGNSAAEPQSQKAGGQVPSLPVSPGK